MNPRDPVTPRRAQDPVGVFGLVGAAEQWTMSLYEVMLHQHRDLFHRTLHMPEKLRADRSG